MINNILCHAPLQIWVELVEVKSPADRHESYRECYDHDQAKRNRFDNGSARNLRKTFTGSLDALGEHFAINILPEEALDLPESPPSS